MNYSDIKDLSNAELMKKRKSMLAELFSAKMKNSLGQLSNPLEIRKMRKDYARVMTAITQKSSAK